MYINLTNSGKTIYSRTSPNSHLYQIVAIKFGPMSSSTVHGQYIFSTIYATLYTETKSTVYDTYFILHS